MTGEESDGPFINRATKGPSIARCLLTYSTSLVVSSTTAGGAAPAAAIIDGRG